jgi:hypothetical protein
MAGSFKQNSLGSKFSTLSLKYFLHEPILENTHPIRQITDACCAGNAMFQFWTEQTIGLSV